MAKNTTTYTVNIKAQLTHLTELKQELNKIANDTTIDLKVSGKKSLNDALTTLESMQKVLATKVDADGFVDSEGFQLFDSLIGPLITKINNLKSALAKILPESVATEFDNINKQVEELQAKLQQATTSYKELKKGWNINLAELGAGEQARPTVNTQNKAVASLPDATYKDTQITTAKQLLQIYSSIDQTQQNLSGEDQKIVQLYNQYQSILNQ